MNHFSAIKQMSFIKSDTKRVEYLATAIAQVNPISYDVIIALAVSLRSDSGDGDESALSALRTVYRAHKNLLSARDVLVRDCYLHLCAKVYPRGNVILVADLIDNHQYTQALELSASSWYQMPGERWQISMLFQALRAAFYIDDQAELGQQLSKELLSRLRPISKMITHDTYRKYLTALQLDFVFELRRAGWNANVGPDKRLMELIVQQFEHQW